MVWCWHHNLESLCEFTRFMQWMQNCARCCRPLDQADGLEPLACLLADRKLHPPSPFEITQPESWYSFYHPTQGRRPSRSRWLVIYPEGLPAREQSSIKVVTGPVSINYVDQSQCANHYTTPSVGNQYLIPSVFIAWSNHFYTVRVQTHLNLPLLSQVWLEIILEILAALFFIKTCTHVKIIKIQFCHKRLLSTLIICKAVCFNMQFNVFFISLWQTNVYT